jgi:hypothetical protein
MGELKEGLDSARKEVENAAEQVKSSSGVSEMNESLRETFREAAPAGPGIETELDEIDQVARQVSDGISGGDSTKPPSADSPASDNAGNAGKDRQPASTE